MVATNIMTGYYLSEMAHPYYEFKAAGLEVDSTSTSGGMASRIIKKNNN